jgi:micrococcal nuclease
LDLAWTFGADMKRGAHGIVLLVVALLVLSHYVLRGWDWGPWGVNAKPELTGQAVAGADGNTVEAVRDGQPGRGRLTRASPAFSGEVVRVLDGDTIEVMHDGQAERVRLNAVDCPEKGQAFGTAAKQFTSSLVFGQTVTVRSSGRDRYRRTIGDVVLPDGRSLNQELIKAGMAWWYRHYSKDRTLEDLESEARSQKRGLWSDADPIAPWEWRRGSKKSALP